MERIRIYAPALMLLLMAVSCINKDILNISDSVELNPRYSVPIGTYDADINKYLESLDTIGPSSGDSLYYEGVLYPINQSYVNFEVSDSLNFNLIKDPSGKVKSVEFIILVSNGYPTPAVVQVYFMSDSCGRGFGIYQRTPCNKPCCIKQRRHRNGSIHKHANDFHAGGFQR